MRLHSKGASILLTCLLTCSLGHTSQAQPRSSGTSLNRMQHPITLYAAMGQPAPSWIGLGLGFQLSPQIQLLPSMGLFWNGEISIHTFAFAARVFLFETNFTPVLGAGLSKFFFSGNGSLQTLESSTFLGSLLVGLDWAIGHQWRIGAGVNFHYPLKLNFPYFELGYSF